MRTPRSRPSVRVMRRFPLCALLATLAVLAGASTASASITLTYSGTTIGIEGGGDNVTYVGFTNTYDAVNGTVTVRNSTGVVNDSGGACVQEDVVPLGTYFHCPASSTALQATYGAGNDRVIMEGVCIPSETVHLGEGANSFEQASTDGCPATQVANVTAGGGQDQLFGGNGPDSLSGGGGNDEIRGGGGDDAVDAGPGDDTLQGNDGNDTIAAGDGQDKVRGGAGNDLEDAGPGNDVLGLDDADPGADDLRGGPGQDELRLNSHAPGVAVTLNDQADDGNPSEGDNVRDDIETFVLSEGDDSFVGSAHRDVVDPWLGNDVARGGGGDDEIVDNSGDDQLFGDAGADLLVGGSGNDTVDGGAGTDTLFGDVRSCDAYFCPVGADRILARDGEVDAISCGAGADTAQVDATDVVSADGFQVCESVDRAAAPVPGPVPPGGDGKPTTPTTPAAFTKPKAVGGKRRFRLTLQLRAAASVSVTVTRKGAKKAPGKTSFKGRKGAVSRTFTKIGRKRLTRGTYRVVVKVGKTSRTLTVKVR